MNNQNKTELLISLLQDESIDVHSILLDLNLIVEKSNIVQSQNKSSLSKIILDEEYSCPILKQRKDIITRLMNECQLTYSGASTYLQNYKKKNGHVLEK